MRTFLNFYAIMAVAIAVSLIDFEIPNGDIQKAAVVAAWPTVVVVSLIEYALLIKHALRADDQANPSERFAAPHD